MKKLGTTIHTNKWGYSVNAVVLRDKNSKRVSVEIYVVTPDGSMSDIITIPKKNVYAKKNYLDFMYDMEGMFTHDDITRLRPVIQNLLQNDNAMITVQDKATLDELHGAISTYIREEAEELSDNADCDIFIKGAYGYMTTAKLEEFCKKHKLLGYKRLEILKRLKIMGALQNGKDRPYDTLVSIRGVKRHFYKIELAEQNQEVEQGEEVIDIGD